jgi:hypothetical protein
MYQKEALHAYKHKNIVAQDKYLNVNPKQWLHSITNSEDCNLIVPVLQNV